MLVFSHPDIRFESPDHPNLRTLLVLPLYHAYGITPLNMGSLYLGHQLVMLRKFEPETFLEAIEKYKVHLHVA